MKKPTSLMVRVQSRLGGLFILFVKKTRKNHVDVAKTYGKTVPLNICGAYKYININIPVCVCVYTRLHIFQINISYIVLYLDGRIYNRNGYLIFNYLLLCK